MLELPVKYSTIHMVFKQPSAFEQPKIVFFCHKIYLIFRNIITIIDTFVWWTPIATISDPTSITTVKIPSIIIRKNSFVFFINHVRDWMVLSSCPDLGKKSDSKNKSHLFLVWKIFLKMRVFLIIFFFKENNKYILEWYSLL